MATIEVRDLVKRYGATTALSGMDLAVDAGEVVTVLGPNGAGKTSLLEILEGYRRRDGGTVRVLGADPAGAGPGWRDRIGVLLQHTSVEPQLTVVEALRMYAGFYQRSRPVDELLALAGLEAVHNRRSGALSGGQQRRLDLALAVCGRPELVFLDEPTTGFDPRARRATWELIGTLAAAGTTVLLTTHYLEEAAELADRVAVLARGRVVAEGDPATLGGHDLSAATVRFRLPEPVPPGAPQPPDQLLHNARDGVVTVRTATPTRLLATVAGWAAAAGVELAELTVTRPTLEEIYLALTREGDGHA
jgi:ABC-2 type transport system ATP-binding protein